MKSWAKWTAKTALVTAGLAAAGGGLPGVALAGTGGPNMGNVAILGGNQVGVLAGVPIDICGNAVAVLGIAAAGCEGGAEVLAQGGPAASSGSSSRGAATTGNAWVGGGNTIQVPVNGAVNACGNAVGNAQARCQGGAILPGGSATREIKKAGLSAGNISAGSGNQVKVPASVPGNVCGNAAAVLGDSNAGCEGSTTVNGSDHGRRGLLSSAQLAGLGTLPGLANLPALAGLTNVPLLQGLANGGSLLPASALSAFTSNVDAGGMSGDSFVTLAVGALLAGAAALKLAGRRPRARKPGAGEASA